jgi:hypothetical protein
VHARGYLNVQDWRNAQSFEAMAYFRNEPVVLREEPEPEQIDAAFTSPDFFALLGIHPVGDTKYWPSSCSAVHLQIVRPSEANR